MIFLKSQDNNEKGSFDAVAKTHSFCSLKWKKTNTNRQLKKNRYDLLIFDKIICISFNLHFILTKTFLLQMFFKVILP